MFSNILVPVDLDHADTLETALTVAADLARLYEASVCLAGVVSTAPGASAHNPTEYAARLNSFASDQTGKRGIGFTAKVMISHDPAVDLDDQLKQAAEEIGADLVVMASHVPGFRDHFFSSKAGYLANHLGISVFIVR